MANLKQSLRNLNWFLVSQVGIDIKKFLYTFKGIFLYLGDLRAFGKRYDGKLQYKPCLHDRDSESGEIQNEYFWQDLAVARMIFHSNPERHVDIGSRVDGFIAHVASFRDIEVFDVRENTTKVPGVIFRKLNFSDFEQVKKLIAFNPNGYCDSISCLHALEHFGLGRYGDPIDPLGYVNGIKSIAMLLSPGGKLYLSTPVGKERVEFNANRVFDPKTIVSCANSNNLELEKLHLVSNQEGLKEIQISEDNLENISKNYYSLALFEFRKHQ